MNLRLAVKKLLSLLPASISGSLVDTGSTQTISGAKTFSGDVTMSGGQAALTVGTLTTDDTSSDVRIGQSGDAQTSLIVQDRAGATVPTLEVQQSDGSAAVALSGGGIPIRTKFAEVRFGCTAATGALPVTQIKGDSRDAASGYFLQSSSAFGWSNTTDDASATKDTTLQRAANGVIKFADVSTGGGTFSAPANTQAQFTGNQDNLALTSKSYFQRWSSDASRNVTGVAAGADGQTHVIRNVGAQNIVLMHQVTSTAANQFYCTTGADLTLAAGKCAEIIYDATTARWIASLRN